MNSHFIVVVDVKYIAILKGFVMLFFFACFIVVVDATYITILIDLVMSITVIYYLYNKAELFFIMRQNYQLIS